MVLGEGLATQGRLPAGLGAWLPNAVVGAAGLVLLVRGGREGRLADLLRWRRGGHAHA
jgi:lipopolysaccharide export LptBFGC system permease protein LptF